MAKSPFDSMKAVQQKTCGVCETPLGEPICRMPKLPITETLVREKLPPTGFLDQAFHVCDRCGHGQLEQFILPEILYGGDYAFRTSLSQASVNGNKYFTDFIERVTEGQRFGTIVDIGCSDLHLLKSLSHRADKLIGIDPMLRTVEVDTEGGKVECIADFFENVDLRRLMSEKGTLFVSSHNIEHLENPNAMIGRILEHADDRTVGAFQFPELVSLIEDFRFDQVIHHHLHYFSLASFTNLLHRNGGRLMGHCFNRPFWGSLLTVFQKGEGELSKPPETISRAHVQQRFRQFQTMAGSVADILELESPERVIAYGAPLTLPTLAYHMRYDFNKAEAVVDDDPSKNGLYYVSLPAQIRNSKDVGVLENTHVVVTALNGVRPILAKLHTQKPKKIIVPLAAF